MANALATINGVKDFISSFVVGLLWTFSSFFYGFLFSAILGAAGTIVLFITHKENSKE